MLLNFVGKKIRCALRAVHFLFCNGIIRKLFNSSLSLVSVVKGKRAFASCECQVSGRFWKDSASVEIYVPKSSRKASGESFPTPSEHIESIAHSGYFRDK